MRRLAITGGIACGKSLCGDFFRALGCPVCDTDGLARGLLARGQPCYDAVVRRFGRVYLDQNKEIDRRHLGRLVFRDKEALADLNSLLHPEIMRRVRRWLTEQAQREVPAAVVLIPLFYEIGERPRDWDGVACVAAPVGRCRQRLRRRGWTVREIEERSQAQWPVSEKMLRADIVFYNNGSPTWLQRQVETVWQRIT